MNISDIIVNSLKYPIDNDEGFFNALVLCSLLAIALIVFFLFMGLGSLLGPDAMFACMVIGALLAGLVILVFALIMPGYALSVMKEGINQSNVIPPMNIGKNIVDTLKLWLLSIIYMIIPIILGVVVAFITMFLGVSMTPDYSSYSSYAYNPITSLTSYSMISWTLSFILGIITFFFQLLLIIASLRLAKSGSLSEAISFSETWADLKNIGILKTILFYAAITVVITMVVVGSLGLLGISGIGIFVIILIACPFVLLFDSYALGLLYSEVA